MHACYVLSQEIPELYLCIDKLCFAVVKTLIVMTNYMTRCANTSLICTVSSLNFHCHSTDTKIG